MQSFFNITGKQIFTAVLFIICAVCIAFCSTYNRQKDELMLEKLQNKTLTDTNEELELRMNQAHERLEKALQQSKEIQKMLHQRELRIKELQDETAKRLRELEQMEQDDADIKRSLSVTVPTELWNKILNETFFNKSDTDKSGAATDPTPTPPTVPPQPTDKSDAQRVDTVHDGTAKSE